MSLAWVAWTAGVAGAELPQYCRDLAAQFGTAPGQLDAGALAALGTCVMTELKGRSAGPSRSDMSVQQPDPPADSPIDKPGWGPWSAPTPWSDGGAKSQPWDDFNR
jgi:hypothetical protein